MRKLKYKAQYLYWVKLRPAVNAVKRGAGKTLVKVCRRHCRSCFRFEAREDDTGGFWKIARKPKPGQAAHCWAHNYKTEWDGDLLACDHWEARWWWNLKEYKGFVRYKLGRLWYGHVKKRLGGLRKPLPLVWVDCYDGMRDEIVPAGEPQCPRCGEMPYSTVQCQFCGQRFLPETGGKA